MKGTPEGFHVARAPARGRYRLIGFDRSAPGEQPACTVGILDAARDRSIQVNLVPTTQRLLGVFHRTRLLKAQWACEAGQRWMLVGGGTGRIPFPGDGPSMGDLLMPLRAVDADLARGIDLLRLGGQHRIDSPRDGRPIYLTAEVNPSGVLRVEVHDDAFCSPLFLGRADATEHDLLPERWPRLLEEAPLAFPEEYARSVPTVWPQAVDLIRDACRGG